jgi:molybdopterin biosynthesis enzyme
VLANDRSDAIIAIGGTGQGRNDRSVATLARLGRLELHGMALSPGESAAFGMADLRPVLLLPGRFDAALAVFLVVGRHLLARLAGRAPEALHTTVRLARKITSTVGMTELVPLRIQADGAMPLASGVLPLQALTRAHGYVLVPPESEGYQAGADVEMQPFP